MMICPACNYEILLHNDYCENCGAPAYLVTAAQTADITHCTYCGARDENGSGDCAICGLKKNFKTSESLIGTCRNCGVAWRNIWMYCKTCGVARENGLVDTTSPLTVHFQPDGVSTLSRGFQSAYAFKHAPPREQYESMPDSRDPFFAYTDFDPADEPEMRTLLSENEVVERMYASREEESAVPGKIDLQEFFSESEIADSRRPTAAREFRQAQELAATSTEMASELPSAAQHASTRGPSPLEIATIAPVQEPQPLAEMDSQSAPLLPENQPSPALSLDSATNEATATSKPAAKPTQTVRVINRVSTPTTPPIDKKLVKIIILLIFLVLLFSALIVSGFRLRDLLGKPQSQASPQPTASPQPAVSASPAPTQPEMLQAPEGMVQVPGGVFRMGTDNGDSFESPAHEVTVAAFFIDRTEVTNAQYAEFLQATNHRSPPDWKSNTYLPGTEKFPIVNVSWQDANDYAAWAGKRLPTEVEWEFAARAKDGRPYPWGSNWDVTKANTSESNLSHPVEVGSYANAANPLGLLDMAGNVWEWTAGEVTSYKDSSIALAPGKVIRGGAFYAPKERARTTFRGFAPADKQAAGIGFRCVKDLH